MKTKRLCANPSTILQQLPNMTKIPKIFRLLLATASNNLRHYLQRCGNKQQKSTGFCDQPCSQGLWVCVQSQYEAFGAPRNVQGTSPYEHPSSGQGSGPCEGLPWPCPGSALTRGLPWPCQETPLSGFPAFCQETSLSPVDGWGTCPAEIPCEPLCNGGVSLDRRGLEDWLPAF